MQSNRLIPIIGGISIVAALVLWGNWKNWFGPWPTWHVGADRQNAEGGIYEIAIDGRNTAPKAPAQITIRCENKRLTVELVIGYVERIGGGTGEATVGISEYFLDEAYPKQMSGPAQTWRIPAGKYFPELDDDWGAADFVRKLNSKPWFAAYMGDAQATFHTEGLSAHMARLAQSCDMTRPPPEQY